MTKLVVQIGYNSFVMEGDKALQLLDTIESAEMFESKYRSEAEGGTSYHIYPQEETLRKVEIMYLTENQYRMYKLAGKPSE